MKGFTDRETLNIELYAVLASLLKTSDAKYLAIEAASDEYDLAKRYFENAIEIRKNILGYNHVSTIEYLDNLAEASGALTDEIGKVETKKEANSLRDELGIKNKK